MSKYITPKLDFSDPVAKEVPVGTLPHDTNRTRHSNLGPVKFNEYERLLEEIANVIDNYDFEAFPEYSDLGPLNAVNNIGSVALHLWQRINDVFIASSSPYTDTIVTGQEAFNELFERTGVGQYKIKDEITAVYFRSGMGDGTADPLKCLDAGSYLITDVLTAGDTIAHGVNINTNNCNMVFCEPGTQIDYTNCEGSLNINTSNCLGINLEIVGDARTDGLNLGGSPTNYVAPSSLVSTENGFYINAKNCVLYNCSVSGRGIEQAFNENIANTESTSLLINCISIGNERTGQSIGMGFLNISHSINCRSFYNGYSTNGYGFKDCNSTNPISSYNGHAGTTGYGVSGGKTINAISIGNLTSNLYQTTGYNIDSSDNLILSSKTGSLNTINEYGLGINGTVASATYALNVTGKAGISGNLDLYGVTTESRSLQIGYGRTGNGYAYIDLIGDATHSDYGFRLERNNTGANASSSIIHRGTGGLIIDTTEGGNVYTRISSVNKLITNQYGIGVNGAVASSSYALNVTGSIHTNNYLYLDGGTIYYIASTDYIQMTTSAINFVSDNEQGAKINRYGISINGAAAPDATHALNVTGNADISGDLQAQDTTINQYGIGVNGAIPSSSYALNVTGASFFNGDVQLAVANQLYFYTEIGDKIYLYSSTYKIGVSSGTLFYEVPLTSKHSFTNNGIENLLINQYGIGVNGAVASSTYALNVTGSEKISSMLGIGTMPQHTAALQVGTGLGIGGEVQNSIGSIHGARRSIQLATEIDYGGLHDDHSGILMFATMIGGWETAQMHFRISNSWGTYLSSDAVIINKYGIGVNGATASSSYALNVTGNADISGDLQAQDTTINQYGIGVNGATATSSYALNVTGSGYFSENIAIANPGYINSHYAYFGGTDGSAWGVLGHNIQPVANTGGYIQVAKTHATFGYRGIVMNYSAAADGIRFYAGQGFAVTAGDAISSSYERMRIANNGLVTVYEDFIAQDTTINQYGIGINGATATSTYALNVTGGANISGDLTLGTGGQLNFANENVLKIDWNSSTTHTLTLNAGSLISDLPLTTYHYFTHGGNNELIINQYGIGINNAVADSTYALNVTGSGKISSMLGIGTMAHNTAAALQVGTGLGIGGELQNSISSIDGARRSIQLATETDYGGTSNDHTGILMFSTQTSWETAQMHFRISNNWGTYLSSDAVIINKYGIGVNGATASSAYALNVTGNGYFAGDLTLGTTGQLSFYKEVGDKIYLYDPTYKISVAASTMAYEVPAIAKHSFTNGGVENLAVNQYGIGVNGATATSSYALSVAGNLNLSGTVYRSGIPIYGYMNDGTPLYSKEVTITMGIGATTNNIAHGITDAHTDNKIVSVAVRSSSGGQYFCGIGWRTSIGADSRIPYQAIWDNTYIHLYRDNTVAARTFICFIVYK